VTVDVIVDGAGTAGPVIAAWLSEDPNVQAGLLAVGGKIANEPGCMRGGGAGDQSEALPHSVPGHPGAHRQASRVGGAGRVIRLL